MGNDVERVVVSNQRTQIQSRDVLNTIFGTYAFSQFLISTDLVAQGLNLGDELRM